MLLQCSSLQRASRSLAKTGFYRVLGYLLDGFFGQLGSILTPFESLLGHFWVTFWILDF